MGPSSSNRAISHPKDGNHYFFPPNLRGLKPRPNCQTTKHWPKQPFLLRRELPKDHPMHFLSCFGLLALLLAPAVSSLGTESPPPSTHSVPPPSRPNSSACAVSRRMARQGWTWSGCLPADRRLRPVPSQGLARQDPRASPTSPHAEEAEAEDLAAHPGPGRLGPVRRLAGRAAAGGHGPLPHREARGQMVAGRSRGPAVLVARHRLRAATENATPITDREQLVRRSAADRTRRWRAFYGRGNWAPARLLSGQAATRPSTSRAPTCCRKYGDDWDGQFGRECSTAGCEAGA